MRKTKRARPKALPQQNQPAKAAPVSAAHEEARDMGPAPEGRTRRKPTESVEDPLGDWPETDNMVDQWLIDREDAEDPPDS